MKFKIVLVPFPFDDFKSEKVRPALCLTNAISPYEHVIISFISSQVLKADLDSDIEILLKDQSSQRTGLKLDSVIRLHRLVTIPKGLIKRELGELPNQYRHILNEKLKIMFDLV